METTPTRRFTRLITALALGMLAAALAHAAGVSEATPLRLQPDANAPVIGTLPAGTAYTPLTNAELTAEGVAVSSPGWVGIHYAGPFFGFADNESVAKDLVLHPAAEVHARPEAASPVIHTVGAGEKVEVVEPAAGWVKVVFRNDRIVFLQSNTVAAPAADKEGPAPAAVSTPPVVVAPDPDKTEPQLIRGYLLEARPVWRSGRKYGYQLVGEDNQRLALLDFSALLQSEPIETFKNRLVEVYGARINVPDVKDIVIRAETLSLAGLAASQ